MHLNVGGGSSAQCCTRTRLFVWPSVLGDRSWRCQGGNLFSVQRQFVLGTWVLGTMRFGQKKLMVPRWQFVFISTPSGQSDPAKGFVSLESFFVQVQQHLRRALPWTHEPRDDKVGSKVLINLWHVTLHSCDKWNLCLVFDTLTDVLGAMGRVAVLSQSLSE